MEIVLIYHFKNHALGFNISAYLYYVHFNVLTEFKCFQMFSDVTMI